MNTTYHFSPNSVLEETMGETATYTFSVYGVEVTDAGGNRWHYVGTAPTDTKEQAEALAAYFTNAAGPDWKPTDAYWVKGQPVYGSPAYVNGGGDRSYHSDLEPSLLAANQEQAERYEMERDERLYG